jgi:hypothetical protein
VTREIKNVVIYRLSHVDDDGTRRVLASVASAVQAWTDDVR